MERALMQQSMRVAYDALKFCNDMEESEEDMISFLQNALPGIKEMASDDETFNRAITMLLLSIDFIYSMTDIVPPGSTYDELTAVLIPKEGEQ